ncbi:MAG TPA: tetratricopeptide repeat protein, partial [Nannocystaceae bacterium]|nr:tetratricopeptide repeat protein [Nannocystaceae bacterium]
YAEAIPVGEAAVAAAREAGADRVVVDGLVVLGDAYDRTGRFDEAELRHAEAVRIAGPIGADDSAAQAAIRLVRNLAQEQSRFDEALAWARHAEGSVARVGRGGHREAELLAAYGVVHGIRADYPASREAFEDALAIERSIDEESLEVAGLRANLAVTLDQLALGDDAKIEHLASIELTERLLGPNHPALAQRLLDLGYTELTFADPEAARGHFERALALLANVQDDTPLTARAFLGLGVAHSMVGEFATAEVNMREALVRFERMYGDEHPWVARAYDDLGYLERTRGRPEIAAGMHRRALEIQIAVHGEDDPETARSRLMLGEALGESGDHEAARRHFATSAAFFEARLGPEHPMVGQVHAQLGHAEAALDRPGKAREHFMRALAISLAATDSVHRIDVVAMQAEVAHCELELGRVHEALASSQRALAEADELERDPSHGGAGAIAWAYFVAAEAELAARGDRQRALGLARASAQRLRQAGRDLPLAADVAELIESLEARGRRTHRH